MKKKNMQIKLSQESICITSRGFRSSNLSSFTVLLFTNAYGVSNKNLGLRSAVPKRGMHNSRIAMGKTSEKYCLVSPSHFAFID